MVSNHQELVIRNWTHHCYERVCWSPQNRQWLLFGWNSVQLLVPKKYQQRSIRFADSCIDALQSATSIGAFYWRIYWYLHWLEYVSAFNLSVPSICWWQPTGTWRDRLFFVNFLVGDLLSHPKSHSVRLNFAGPIYSKQGSRSSRVDTLLDTLLDILDTFLQALDRHTHRCTLARPRETKRKTQIRKKEN